MARYERAGEQQRSELRRCWAAALMHAQHIPWDQIDQALGIQDARSYMSLDIWRDVYEAAEEATLGEAAADAIACLRKLCRSRSEYVRAQAANTIMQARAKQWKQRKETEIKVEDPVNEETRKLLDQIKTLSPATLRALLATPIETA